MPNFSLLAQEKGVSFQVPCVITSTLTVVSVQRIFFKTKSLEQTVMQSLVEKPWQNFSCRDIFCNSQMATIPSQCKVLYISSTNILFLLFWFVKETSLKWVIIIHELCIYFPLPIWGTAEILPRFRNPWFGALFILTSLLLRHTLKLYPTHHVHKRPRHSPDFPRGCLHSKKPLRFP